MYIFVSSLNQQSRERFMKAKSYSELKSNHDPHRNVRTKTHHTFTGSFVLAMVKTCSRNKRIEINFEMGFRLMCLIEMKIQYRNATFQVRGIG